jgi:hypothetical protein
MKQLIITAVLLFSITAFAQVGINNTSPKATLDITAKTNGTKPEGLIIPQLSGSDIRTATAASVYGTAQKGLIVYASAADSAPAGATTSITAPGYYYFDGSAWQKIATGNTLNTSLASGNILMGNASNVATAVSPTGDVTISNAGITSIGAGKVTNTQMASAAALTVKGNATNAAASPTDIAAGTDGYVLRRSGTSLGFGTVSTAGIADGAITTNKIATDAVTSTQIASGAVSNADLASAAALTVKGNATNAAASPTDIAAGTDGYVLRRSGTTLGFGTVDTAGITDGAVTTAKIASGAVTNADLASAAALTVKGNATNAAASPTDIAAGTDGYVLRRSGTALGFGTVDTAGITDGAVTSNKILDATVANIDLATGTGGIYKGSGSLASNTTVAQNANTLDFTSTATTGTSHFTVDGSTFNINAVGNNVGIGTNTPNSSALLDLNSSNKGILFPKVNLSGVNDATTITSPSTGLVIYNTNTSLVNGVGLYINSGTSSAPIWDKLIVGTIGAGASSVGQIMRYPCVTMTVNAGSIKPVSYHTSFIQPNGANGVINTISGGSLAADNSTLNLPAGTYRVDMILSGAWASAPAINAGSVQIFVNGTLYSDHLFTAGTTVGDVITLTAASTVQLKVSAYALNFTLDASTSGSSTNSIIAITRLL